MELMILIPALVLATGTITFVTVLLLKKSSAVAALREKCEQYLEAKILAESALNAVQTRSEELNLSVKELRQEIDKERDLRYEMEKQAELARQQVDATEKRLADWEKSKEESLQTARATVAKVGQELSSKLLEDHKRESEVARKHSEENIKKSTEHIHQQIEKMVGRISSQHDRLEKCESTMGTVWKALSSPADVGQSSEIGLKNTFESFGLENGRDFFLQYSVTAEEGAGQKLRPDAVLFLGAHVLVVDSKASQFFLAYAAAEGEQEEQRALKALKQSMNTHLNALRTKNYREVVAEQIQQDYEKTGRSGDIGHTYMVMYVPNDTAIETLYKADPEFSRKMIQSDIILAGPSVLKGLMMVMHFQVAETKRAENHAEILEEVKKLISNISILHGYTEDIGKGIKRAFDNYNKLAGSFNRTLLSNVKHIHALGVGFKKQKSVPTPLPRYQVVTSIVEGEEPKDVTASVEVKEKKLVE